MRYAYLFITKLLKYSFIAFIISFYCTVNAYAFLSQNDKTTLVKISDYMRKGDFNTALRLKKKLNNQGAQSYVDWKYLTDNNSVPNYRTLIAYIRSNPNMPKQDVLQSKLENTLSALSFKQQKSFFTKYHPVSTQGRLTEIDYLMQTKQTTQAKSLLKLLWHSKNLSGGQQEKILSAHHQFLSRQDHSKRITYLLDNSHYSKAKSLLKYAYKTDALKYDLRYKLNKRHRLALANYKKSSSPIKQDAGVLRSLVYYYRKKDQELNAINVMKNLTRKQSQNNPIAWYQSRAILSRVAFKRGLKKAAYTIIANNFLESGGKYVEAEFYAGWLALRHFRENNIALKHFKNGRGKSGMPISISRFEYWIGRSCQALNDKPCEKISYTNASQYFYTFYGQLAAHHLKQQKIMLPKYPKPDKRIKSAFFKDSVVQAAYAAKAFNSESDVRLLLASIAERTNKHEAIFLLLENLSKEIGNLKTRVKVAKYASKNNDFLIDTGYPVIDLKKIGAIPERALIYALTRQESEFDQYARSHVGARGLMQIMPATAKQLARQLGKKHRLAYLTQKPEYNMTLGGFYLNNLVKKFNGSYIHALSGYNAGPSRIPQWDESYGRFNKNLYQIIDRIETIPFSETRNYVQRILETVQVYRSKLKGRNYIAVNELIYDLKRGL
ncbi:MAG: soluble lytic murein transglycosylase [Alphaproteobacteria bacterium]|jgi:soluble lytic murein transglycosylase